MGIFPSQRKVTGYDPLAFTVTINTGRCMFCSKDGEVTMPSHAWELYADGEGQQIQYAWPEGSMGEREQVMNGTHPACFAEMFPPPPEEEDTQSVNYANGDTP